MKKLISLLLIQLVPLILVSQSIDKLDRIQGYKEFRFGGKIAEYPKSFSKSTIEKDQNIYSLDSTYTQFFSLKSQMLTVYYDEDIVYKVSFLFEDSDVKIKSQMGVKTKLNFIWDELNSLFGEPTSSERKLDFFGFEYYIYSWESQKNILQFEVYKEGESMSVHIYDKVLFDNYRFKNF